MKSDWMLSYASFISLRTANFARKRERYALLEPRLCKVPSAC